MDKRKLRRIVKDQGPCPTCGQLLSQNLHFTSEGVTSRKRNSVYSDREAAKSSVTGNPSVIPVREGLPTIRPESFEMCCAPKEGKSGLPHNYD
jgi:hypothetical protein